MSANVELIPKDKTFINRELNLKKVAIGCELVENKMGIRVHLH